MKPGARIIDRATGAPGTVLRVSPHRRRIAVRWHATGITETVTRGDVLAGRAAELGRAIGAAMTGRAWTAALVTAALLIFIIR